MCYDSQAWIEQVARGLVSPPAGGMIPPGMPGHSPGIGLPYDPPKARQLLAEAGYPGGRGFPEINVLIVKEYADSETGARDRGFYQQTADNLGVKVNFDMVPGKEINKVRDLGRDHIYFGNWNWDYPDPHNLLSLGISSTFSPMYGWHNPSYEQLVQTADATMDQAERIKLYQRADQILVQDAPCILWGHPLLHFLVKPWVKKFDSSANRFRNFSEVILEGH
jgi:ABC-type transport system substrate-binding protein